MADGGAEMALKAGQAKDIDSITVTGDNTSMAGVRSRSLACNRGGIEVDQDNAQGGGKALGAAFRAREPEFRCSHLRRRRWLRGSKLWAGSGRVGNGPRQSVGAHSVRGWKEQQDPHRGGPDEREIPGRRDRRLSERLGWRRFCHRRPAGVILLRAVKARGRAVVPERRREAGRPPVFSGDVLGLEGASLVSGRGDRLVEKPPFEKGKLTPVLLLAEALLPQHRNEVDLG